MKRGRLAERVGMAGTTRRLRLATAAVAAGESQLERHFTLNEKRDMCIYFFFNLQQHPALRILFRLAAARDCSLRV